MVSRQINGIWTRPAAASLSGNGIDVDMTFDPDGKRLYFSATCPGGMGGKDIYYSDPVNGEFTKPVNIGPAVNTEHSEGDSFVDPDERFLIVSARGRPDTLGEGDLYITSMQEDGTWSTPTNIGEPVNSKATEYCPMVTPDGKYLFFSRYSNDKSDIYWVSAEVLDQSHH